MSLRLEYPFKALREVVQHEMRHWPSLDEYEIIYYPLGLWGGNDKMWHLRNGRTRDTILSTNSETELIAKLLSIAVANEVNTRESHPDWYR